MKKKYLDVIDTFIILAQFALSALLIYLMFDLLPVKLLAILSFGLLFVWIIIWNILDKKTNKGKMIIRLISLILSVMLALGSIISFQGLDTIRKITGLNYQTSVYSVVVLKDSSYQQLSDLTGKSIGVVANLDRSNTAEALSNIQNSIQIASVDYSKINELQSGLFKGEVKSILMNEAYRAFMNEINREFEANTRVIYTYKIKESVDDGCKDVKVTKEPFNIYISGIDTYGEVSSVSRSDVNMIVTVNPKTKTILMTSIPRDYYVKLDSFNQKDKLTHAGLYGINESIHTLENLFNIDINYYARVNFTSVETIVDALDGITVYNEEEFTSWTKHIYFPVGTLALDGEKTLEFVRERYALSGGDRSRIKNQQIALTAMLDKAMSPSIIYNYSDVLKAVGGCFQTNMESNDITGLIQYQLSNMSSWNIIRQQVDGTGTSSSSCYSMSGTSLYVMEPDMNTVIQATNQINQVMKG